MIIVLLVPIARRILVLGLKVVLIVSLIVQHILFVLLLWPGHGLSRARLLLPFQEASECRIQRVFLLPLRSRLLLLLLFQLPLLLLLHLILLRLLRRQLFLLLWRVHLFLQAWDRRSRGRLFLLLLALLVLLVL